MRRVACFIAVIMLRLMFGLIAPPPAFAHDDVVATSPSNGEQVTEVPEEVRIDLADTPGSGAGSVTGPDGQASRVGRVRIAGKTLVITIRPTTALGTYTVEFRMLSADGHPTSGTLSFEVVKQSASDAASPASDSPTTANANASATRGGGVSEVSLAWLWAAIAGGGGLAALRLLIALGGSRARKL